MKKKMLQLLLPVILLLVGGFLMINVNQKLQLELGEDNSLSILLTSDYNHQRIYPWYNETDGKYYFFLPAYCKTENIRFKVGKGTDASLNGMHVHSDSKFEWQEKDIYQLELRTDNTVLGYDLVFLKSENLPALFISTDSGNMEYLHQDKENEEQGNISIVTAEGNMEYNGRLSKISGRGNSTWSWVKKPYSIKLQEKRPLLGMDAGDKWCLLAGLCEGAKMNDKVAFDLAELVGLDYSPQCTWIDLYLNGEYAGIYLLAESVSVGEGRVDINDLEKQNKANNPNIEEADTFEEDGMKGYIINNSGNISGGYLFEKDYNSYWEDEGAGFKTSKNNTFTINSPQNASREQVEYLSKYVRNIDDMINDSNVEYRNYIDFESFTKKFIVDEIALSYDVNSTSMFYYKKIDDDLLYAGPVWDFDLAFGEGNGDKLGEYWVNYEFSSIYPLRSEDEILNWYARLYDDEVFRTQVIKTYSDALPYIEELIESKIDIYADYIRKSVELDNIRWDNIHVSGGYPGHYKEFDNNVRYLKFFLAKRINYLNERWNVNFDDLALPNHEGIHKISFLLDGEVIETREVADGDTLEDMPYLDDNAFPEWRFTHSGEKYRVHIPIYEDTDFYAQRKEK